MNCPYCGVDNEAATGLTGARTPKAGDVSLCYSCDGVGVFTGDGLEVRLPTAEEQLRIGADPRVGKAKRISELLRRLS